MKVVISIYKTNADGSNSLYMVSGDSNCFCDDWGIPLGHIRHYGWKHETPDPDKLSQALALIWESTKQT